MNNTTCELLEKIKSNTKDLIKSGFEYQLENLDDLCVYFEDVLGVSFKRASKMHLLWDTFQMSGDLKRYRNAFTGWNSRYILPKHKLCPGDAYLMFDGCSNLIIPPDIDFSECRNVQGIFRNCTSLKMASVCAPLAIGAYVFNNCQSLKTIEYLNLPSATNYTASFYRCESLKNIYVEPNSIKASVSFNFCYNLTPESVENIVKGLCDDVTGQTLIISNEAYSRYNAAFPEKNSGDMTAFDVLMTLKPNWAHGHYSNYA